MLVVEANECTAVYGHRFGSYTVRTEVPVDEETEVVVAWNPGSTLYPEYLPRWTGNWLVDEKTGERYREIVLDIPNCRSGWYMRYIDPIIRGAL